jgi:hypothetical protein
MTQTKAEARAVSRAWKRRNAARVKAARAAYYVLNKEKELAQSKEWHDRNRAAWNAIRRKRRADDPEPHRARARRWHKKHRKQRAAYQLNRYHTVPWVRIKTLLSASLRQSLRRIGRKKGWAMESLVGCTWEQFKKHIESQFKAGMSWDRAREIHLDHVRPVSWFDLTDPVQVKACYHYTNLQPPWASRNHAKGNRWAG